MQLLAQKIICYLLLTFSPLFVTGKQLDGIWYESSFCYFDSQTYRVLQTLLFHVMCGSQSVTHFWSQSR